MNYLNTETKEYPVTYEMLASRFPNTSFPPEGFTPPTPYVAVRPSAVPPYETATQIPVEGDPLFLPVGGTLPDGSNITAKVWTQQWVLTQKWNTEEEKTAAREAAQTLADAKVRYAAKKLRAATVDAIKVTTTAGNTFDGDEVSQGRMARAIIALQAVGSLSITWVLADNTTIQATAAELTEALVLAGQAQAAVWVV